MTTDATIAVGLREALTAADEHAAQGSNEPEHHEHLQDAFDTLREGVLSSLEVAGEATLVQRLDAAALLAASRAAQGFVKWAEHLHGVVQARAAAADLPVDGLAEELAQAFDRGHREGRSSGEAEVTRLRSFIAGLERDATNRGDPTSMRFASRLRDVLDGE